MLREDIVPIFLVTEAEIRLLLRDFKYNRDCELDSSNNEFACIVVIKLIQNDTLLVIVTGIYHFSVTDVLSYMTWQLILNFLKLHIKKLMNLIN